MRAGVSLGSVGPTVRLQTGVTAASLVLVCSLWLGQEAAGTSSRPCSRHATPLYEAHTITAAAACNAGLKHGLLLPPPVDGNQEDPSVTGRHQRLPTSLSDSLAEYHKDTELQVCVWRGAWVGWGGGMPCLGCAHECT
jgi:hypothetical protein